MLVVVGEDDGLADHVAALDLQPVFHQVLEHEVAGRLVEELLEEVGAGQHFRRRLAVGVLDPLALLLGEVRVLHALAHELRRVARDRVRHEEPVGDRLLQRILVVGHAVLAVEELVGRFLHLPARGRREAHEQAVVVLEDRAVLVEHAAVRLVDDHEVETADAELLALAVHVVDHRLVRGEHHPRVQVLAGVA